MGQFTLVLLSGTANYKLRPAFNPMDLIVERRDYSFSSVSSDGGYTRYPTAGVDRGLVAGDKVYIRSASGVDYTGLQTVTACSIAGITTDRLFSATGGGFISSEAWYANSKILVEVTINDIIIGEMAYTVGGDMRATIDVRQFAIPYLNKDNTFGYLAEGSVDATEPGLMTDISFRMMTIYDGWEDDSPVATYGSAYTGFIVNSAIQIGHNPDLQLMELGAANGGMFLTEFTTVKVFKGYPNSLQFIWR